MALFFSFFLHSTLIYYSIYECLVYVYHQIDGDLFLGAPDHENRIKILKGGVRKKKKKNEGGDSYIALLSV